MIIQLGVRPSPRARYRRTACRTFRRRTTSIEPDIRRQAQRPDVLDRHAERVAERFVLFVRQVFLIPEGGHSAERRQDRPRQGVVVERQTRHPSVAIGGDAVPRTEGSATVPIGRGGPMCPAGRGVDRDQCRAVVLLRRGCDRDAEAADRQQELAV